MMNFTEQCRTVFNRAIRDYHKTNDVDAPFHDPYQQGTIEYDLYHKCWIDAVQWHLEDLIREPSINPVEALALKRRIDRSNQERTDLVETIDSYFYTKYHDVAVDANASINTESPAWAIDRLSILALKIYHMSEQTERTDAPHNHIEACRAKLDILLQQQEDLSTAINRLLDDIASGRKYMKVYKQMKMYNDPNLNPVLYAGNTPAQESTPL